MFGNNTIKGVASTGILDKISKILGLANQAIPLYKEIKPIVTNSKNILNVLKDINTKPIKKTIETKALEKSDTNLTFFQ